MVTDNSGVPPSLTPNRQSGSYFSAPGSYEVIYRAADSSGNVATCSFGITLKSKWKVCVGRHMAISTQRSSVHVEERYRERIPKPVSTGVENATHGQITPYTFPASYLFKTSVAPGIFQLELPGKSSIYFLTDWKRLTTKTNSTLICFE